jgi:hypothetical protein
MAKAKAQPASTEAQMTMEEAKAFRASLYKPVPKMMTEAQKREAFRIFWAANKKKYGRAKSIEKALWLHLKAMGMHSPEHFAQGLQNFGLKKVK